MVQSGRWIPVFRGDILLTSSRHPEDKGIMFLRDVRTKIPDYTVP